MSAIFTCDKCKKEFGGALDTLTYQGKVYDLCAPCRKELSDKKTTVEDEFFNEM